MTKVRAPDGYEGVMFFDDAIREYRVAYRHVGSTWWTNCWRTAGGRHISLDERQARAENVIITQLEVKNA